MTEKKVRSSNIELIRIVAMFGIALSHYQFFLGEMMAEAPSSLTSMVHYTYSMWRKIGINCFMLITGYFMCVQSTSLKKYAKLLSQIYFYNIVIYVAFILAGKQTLTFGSLTYALFPFREISPDNFITDFLWFYLLLPFLSITAQNLGKKMHAQLVVLLLLVNVGY